jgi:hypothetical protein
MACKMYIYLWKDYQKIIELHTEPACERHEIVHIARSTGEF